MARKVSVDALAEVLADYATALRVIRWLDAEKAALAPKLARGVEPGDGWDNVLEKLARDFATDNKAERAALEAALALVDEDC